VNRRAGYAFLAALGLVVYLLPALRAPVVLWSDSLRDLEWARAGIGILSPAPIPAVPHPAKPFYILFLQTVAKAAPGEKSGRAIVVVQSVLVWLALGLAALAVARRVSPGRGALLYVVLLLLLRVRDASSAVMSEAPATALFLVLAAALLDPPEGIAGPAVFGLGAGVLFLVRPNEGAAAVALAMLTWATCRRGRAAAVSVVVFAALVLPIWLATAPKGDFWRGLSPAFRAAEADYGWTPAEGLPSPAVAADARRELLWRALHGVFGTEFYDARWSPAYRAASELSRLLTPWLVLGAIAALAAAPRNPASPARLLGLGLAAILVAQSFVLGALPRFALPMLPALLLFAFAAPPAKGALGTGRLAIAAAVFGALTALLVAQRDVLDWEWGKVEGLGVRLVQPIPRGALPETAPATLHLRIAAPELPTGAGVSVRGPDGALLYESTPSSEKRRPFLTVPLPQTLLDRGRSEPVVLTIEAVGSYDPAHFLLFPVVPPPWGAAARREGSREISPDSGVTRGGFDWWAHPGTDP